MQQIINSIPQPTQLDIIAGNIDSPLNGESALVNIGVTYGIGLGVGGLIGGFQGLLRTRDETNFKLRMNRVITSAGASSTAMAQGVGVLAVFYSVLKTGLSLYVSEEDMHRHRILIPTVCGALSGAMYRCTSGLRAIAVATTLGAAFTGGLAVARERLEDKYDWLTSNNRMLLMEKINSENQAQQQRQQQQQSQQPQQQPQQ
eukprot:comp19016_c0_seq1/m.35106 comp19016_c0_seq1/g.35106  ORF comp19016_c0_seq1/g.35106 comp19016_c0_seq1/m.35106 type:complete len:202 (-) comp19016_c0_seq1:45-650(-)